MAEQPRGTVTLLFTDIEGSTRLLERLGRDRYAETLDLHCRLLRTAFERQQGYEVHYEGDSFFAAFARAEDAVAAAAEAQQALSTATWPAEEGVRVRIGIHTGEPLAAPPKYVGLDVHKAARVMAAAHGGQVLLSQTTADLLSGRELEPLSLRDLGEHRLKDLTQPQRLYQLSPGGSAGEFPPPRSLENRPTNLPVQPTPLIGRERELAELETLVSREDVRLVTLTGPAGTGKTRLALQLAADQIERFPDGVWFVNLAAVTDPELVLPTLAQTLGVRDVPERPLAELLADELTRKQTLILLDNFEQVAAAAPTLASLIARTRSVVFVVTSRVALRVAAEHEYAAPSLDPDEAVTLFAERAQAVKHTFVLNGNRSLIAEICRRLDHLPLAIELAAARIKLLPERALLERLDQRLKLLTGGARDLPARQQTLRAAIDWSYGLLDEPDQRLFARLAVFSGGRSLEAMEVVANPDGDLDVLEGVASLVDKSLLRQEETVDGEPRYLMLETIHEYAGERLAETEDEARFQRRHADFFLSLAEEAAGEVRGPDGPRWLERLEREHDNIRAALGWAIEHREGRTALGVAFGTFRLWLVRGYLREGTAWLGRALEISQDQPAPLRTKAFAALAVLSATFGQMREADAAAEQARSLSKRLNDPALDALVLWACANVAHRAHDLRTAGAYYDRSREAAIAAGDHWSVASATLAMGDMAMADGDDEKGRELNEAALDAAHRAGLAELEETALFNLAELARRAGDTARARELLRTTTEFALELRDREVLIWVLLELAAFAREEGRIADAASLAAVGEHHRQRIGLNLGTNELELYETTMAAAVAELTPEALAAIEGEARSSDLAASVADALADAERRGAVEPAASTLDSANGE